MFIICMFDQAYTYIGGVVGDMFPIYSTDAGQEIGDVEFVYVGF